MGAKFLKGNLQLPMRDEPLEDIDGNRIELGAEEGLGLPFADGIANQQPPDGHGR
jgi:hypothetical protein